LSNADNLDVCGTAIKELICPSDTSQGLMNDRANLGNHPTWFFFNHTTGGCGVPLNYRVGMVDLYAARSDWGRNYSFFSRHPGGMWPRRCGGDGAGCRLSHRGWLPIAGVNVAHRRCTDAGHTRGGRV